MRTAVSRREWRSVVVQDGCRGFEVCEFWGSVMDVRGLSDRALIARMNKAEDFGYDDEQVELDRRLAGRGLQWRWGPEGRMFDQRVEVFDPATGQVVNL